MVFIAEVLLSAIGIFVDIVNPHSFLGLGGFFVRVLLAFVFAFFWLKLCLSELQKLRIGGLAVCAVCVFTYTFAGLTMLANNSGYQ